MKDWICEDPGCGRSDFTSGPGYASHRRSCPDARGMSRRGRTEASLSPAAQRKPRKTRESVESITLADIPSCSRCAHAPVCILRARIASAADDLTKSVEMTLAGIEEAPSLRIDVGCSLYAPAVGGEPA